MAYGAWRCSSSKVALDLLVAMFVVIVILVFFSSPTYLGGVLWRKWSFLRPLSRGFTDYGPCANQSACRFLAINSCWKESTLEYESPEVISGM